LKSEDRIPYEGRGSCISLCEGNLFYREKESRTSSIRLFKGGGDRETGISRSRGKRTRTPFVEGEFGLACKIKAAPPRGERGEPRMEERGSPSTSPAGECLTSGRVYTYPPRGEFMEGVTCPGQKESDMDHRRRRWRKGSSIFSRKKEREAALAICRRNRKRNARWRKGREFSESMGAVGEFLVQSFVEGGGEGMGRASNL